MIHKIFSIRDTKADVFHPPFFSPTHGEAERNFHAAVRDPKTQFNQFPEDFDLYFLGEYNTNDGKFTTEPTPKHVMKAISCVKLEQ
jgi:hypothetical protein